MNKKIAIVLVGIVSISLLAIIGFGDDMTSRNNSQTTSNTTMTPASDSPSFNENNDMNQPVETTTVSIRDFAFMPEKIVIKKGTTVTWTNEDEARHDITPDNPSEAFMGSDLLAKGESYSFTFNQVGTYTYICSPHPYMTASVEVIE